MIGYMLLILQIIGMISSFIGLCLFTVKTHWFFFSAFRESFDQMDKNLEDNTGIENEPMSDLGIHAISASFSITPIGMSYKGIEYLDFLQLGQTIIILSYLAGGITLSYGGLRVLLFVLGLLDDMPADRYH